MIKLAAALGLLGMLFGCGQPNVGRRELHIAAASNLASIVPEIGTAFEKVAGARIVPSYGSTAQLARQIENGAPIDVFMAADTRHVEELVAAQHAVRDTRMIYARGRLAVWAPMRKDLLSLADLASAGVTSIAIAKPELAPYGEAAVQALRSAGLWDKLEKKIVFAPSIMAAKQMADSGNADAAITAMSLVVGRQGYSFPVDPALYQPIDQAACVTSQAIDTELARRFLAFLASEQMGTLFRRYGYSAN